MYFAVYPSEQSYENTGRTWCFGHDCPPPLIVLKRKCRAANAQLVNDKVCVCVGSWVARGRGTDTALFLCVELNFDALTLAINSHMSLFSSIRTLSTLSNNVNFSGSIHIMQLRVLYHTVWIAVFHPLLSRQPRIDSAL